MRNNVAAIRRILAFDWRRRHAEYGMVALPRCYAVYGPPILLQRKEKAMTLTEEIADLERQIERQRARQKRLRALGMVAAAQGIVAREIELDKRLVAARHRQAIEKYANGAQQR